MYQPRLVISGLSGGSGKTLLSLSLTRAFARLGLSIQPCKKGPDYIDTAWLSLAAHRPAANLDPYFLSPDQLRQQFALTCRRHRPFFALNTPAAHIEVETNSSDTCDLAIIEGNRGLYDGRDVSGHCSTAQVAMTLQAPVLLILNCAKMTRTAAALVQGIKSFQPEMYLGGVVINNVASARHASQIRQALEQYTDVPVLGTVPRIRHNPFPERHMGLTFQQDQSEAEAALERMADYISLHVDLDAILALANTAPPLPDVAAVPLPFSPEKRPRIGYVHDASLWFYYHENLEALEAAGANLIPLSLLDHAAWPDLDGLYMGGGYPELHAEALSISPHLRDIQALSHAGKPIYAECGGLLILCQSLLIDSKNYPMCGLLPIHSQFYPRPQGLGYVEATTLLPNPFHPVGSIWRGHEFHYSRTELVLGPTGIAPLPYLLRLAPGTGMAPDNEFQPHEQGLDGICVRKTFASYTHLYAPAVPHWAPNFVKAALNTSQ